MENFFSRILLGSCRHAIDKYFIKEKTSIEFIGKLFLLGLIHKAASYLFQIFSSFRPPSGRRKKLFRYRKIVWEQAEKSFVLVLGNRRGNRLIFLPLMGWKFFFRLALPSPLSVPFRASHVQAKLKKFSSRNSFDMIYIFPPSSLAIEMQSNFMARKKRQTGEDFAMACNRILGKPQKCLEMSLRVFSLSEGKSYFCDTFSSEYNPLNKEIRRWLKLLMGSGVGMGKVWRSYHVLKLIMRETKYGKCVEGRWLHKVIKDCFKHFVDFMLPVFLASVLWLRAFEEILSEAF